MKQPWIVTSAAIGCLLAAAFACRTAHALVPKPVIGFNEPPIIITVIEPDPTPPTEIRPWGFFDIFVYPEDFLPPDWTPGGSATHELSNNVGELKLDVNGVTTTYHPGVSATARFDALPLGGPGVHPFDTEMLAFNLQGGDFPAGLMIRESPTLASLGQTTITDIGGGQVHIDSFFDVFVELSLDGGQSWTPGDSPMHLIGIPEPSTLTLAGLGLVACAAMAVRRTRRRR